MAETVAYLSELNSCFSWPHNHEGLPQPLQEYGRFINHDHIIPHQAFQIYKDVLRPVFKKPYNQTTVCMLHHGALEICKDELFRNEGLLGVIYFAATDYPQPHPDDEELHEVFRGQKITLFDEILDSIKQASNRGPSGKISRYRMEKFPQIRRVLEVSLDFLIGGNLVVPKQVLDLAIQDC